MTDGGSNRPAVPELLDRLRAALRDRTALFSRVGGEVALIIVGHEPPDFTIRLGASHEVEIAAGKAQSPIVTIGIKPAALLWLIEGTLDVERAFQNHRLAVEGDPQAMARFAQCFAPPTSLLDARKSR